MQRALLYSVGYVYPIIYHDKQNDISVENNTAVMGGRSVFPLISSISKYI